MDHREVLRREFERIAALTEEAYQRLEALKPSSEVTSDVMSLPGLRALEAVYKDWAGLLLRYHGAIEQITGKEDQTPPRSMKGSNPAAEARADDRVAL